MPHRGLLRSLAVVARELTGQAKVRARRIVARSPAGLFNVPASDHRKIALDGVRPQTFVVKQKVCKAVPKFKFCILLSGRKRRAVGTNHGDADVFDRIFKPIFHCRREGILP